MCVGFWGPPPSAKLIIFLWTSLSGRGHLWRRLVPCSLSEQRDGCDLCCGVGFFFERELPFLEVMVKTSSSQPSMACKDRFIYIYIYILYASLGQFNPAIMETSIVQWIQLWKKCYIFLAYVLSIMGIKWDH